MINNCSIVIRAFNEEAHIARLMDGVRHQTVKDVQIILVDSGSSDQTVSIAKHYGAEIIEIEPEQFTFGRSLNKGIEAAEKEWVVIASAHVYPVYPDWLDKLLEPFSDPAVALVYGKQRGSETSKFSEKQVFLHWYPEKSRILQDHPFCNNANAAIRKELWRKHVYDEMLPGLEDLEWAKWALENNYRIAYSADAEIVHVHDETWGGIRRRYLREGMAFKQIYPHEKFGLFDLLHLFFTNAANDFLSAGRQSVLRKELFNVIKFRWNQFYGTYLGYRRSGPLTWQLKQSFYYPKNHIGKTLPKTRQGIAPIDYSGK